MFSKPVPKPPEPTLPRSPSRAVRGESSDNERVRSKRNSAEYRAFRKCFADLAGASGILDPGWLADQLFSKELIGSDIRREAHNPAIPERVKVERLLSAVEDQIVTSPATNFRKFLDVLQSEPPLQDLATSLENTHQKLLGLCTTMSISSSPHPQHPPSNSSPSPPPAKRPRTDISQHLTTRLENTHSEFVGATQHSKVQARNATGMVTDVLDVSRLSSELATVINWHQLGLNLSLPKHELDKIECDYQGNDRQRLEMLDKWLKQMLSAVWVNVVSALKQMGENRVAENIHQKYVGSGGKSH